MKMFLCWLWRWDLLVTYCYSDWDSNCLGCECKWSSGKKVANCTNAKLNSIPQNLHAEVQVLILDYNFISSLGENIFIRNLPNLQKISLRHCGIKTINEKAFNGLKILVEVDLSFNNITKECRFKTEILLKLRYLDFYTDRFDVNNRTVLTSHFESFFQKVRNPNIQWQQSIENNKLFPQPN